MVTVPGSVVVQCEVVEEAVEVDDVVEVTTGVDLVVLVVVAFGGKVTVTVTVSDGVEDDEIHVGGVVISGKIWKKIYIGLSPWLSR